MNIFLASIETGKITSERELKRLFWRLSLRLHPDTAAIADSGASFLRLKSDYDEALLFLSMQSGRSLKKGPAPGLFNRSKCLQTFADLVASGFPVDPSVRNSNKGYLRKLIQFSKEFSASASGNMGLFEKAETELYEIRGDDIILNQLFGLIVMIFYNVCSFHYNHQAHSKRTVIKLFEEIQEPLRAGKRFAALRFIEWLVDDLANGGAL